MGGSVRAEAAKRPALEMSTRRRWAVTAGVMTGMFLAALEATVVGTAMPTVISSLGGLTLKPGENGVSGFAIAGEDRRFVWADAVVHGKEVWVSSPQVKFPIAVRYGWADNPVSTLYNGAGLPATPFRTDDFKAGGVGFAAN